MATESAEGGNDAVKAASEQHKPYSAHAMEAASAPARLIDIPDAVAQQYINEWMASIGGILDYRSHPNTNRYYVFGRPNGGPSDAVQKIEIEFTATGGTTTLHGLSEEAAQRLLAAFDDENDD